MEADHDNDNMKFESTFISVDEVKKEQVDPESGDGDDQTILENPIFLASSATSKVTEVAGGSGEQRILTSTSDQKRRKSEPCRISDMMVKIKKGRKTLEMAKKELKMAEKKLEMAKRKLEIAKKKEKLAKKRQKLAVQNLKKLRIQLQLVTAQIYRRQGSDAG